MNGVVVECGEDVGAKGLSVLSIESLVGNGSARGARRHSGIHARVLRRLLMPAGAHGNMPSSFKLLQLDQVAQLEVSSWYYVFIGGKVCKLFMFYVSRVSGVIAPHTRSEQKYYTVAVFQLKLTVLPRNEFCNFPHNAASA